MRGLTIVLSLWLMTSVIGKPVEQLKELSRRKRNWGYPDLRVQEFDDEFYFKRKEVGKVKSDESNVASYRLTPQDAKDEGIFSIDKQGDSGVIYVEKFVDREEQEVYNLLISALDDNGNPVEDDVQVTIKITDVNDNAPVFDKTTLVADVQEDDKGDSAFHTVLATDADSDENDYNLIYFSKVEGSEKPAGDRFKVMGNGRLVAVGDLDAENVPRVTFEIKARDRGNYTARNLQFNEATAVVTVNILDANDHAPVFLNAPYELTVGELQSVGSNIYTIEATDEDKGLNSEVTFEIVDGNSDNRFRIESIPSESGKSLGKLYINKALDYETQPRTYDFTILGYNKDATNPDDPTYQSETTLTIIVKDENEPPVFQNTPYAGTITEGMAVTQTLGRVQAVDEDFGGQNVVYSIENEENWFNIDATGTIKSNQAIDREHESVHDGLYILQIKASDGSEESFAEYPITVVDRNDNAPQPEGGGWEVNICSNFEGKENTIITTISAKDIDGPTNGAPFSFGFLPNSHFRMESLGNTSALVYPAISNYEIGANYNEVVRIQDSPESETVQTGTATLSINVCRCDDEGRTLCGTDAAAVTAGVSMPIIIAIVIIIAVLLVIILAAMSYQRKRTADIQKKGLLYDEDDVRENLQPYHDEGGGEEDNDIYDMGVLSRVDPSVPIRVEEKPLRAEPQSRPLMPPDSNIEEYIDNAKKQADGDPTAPPFDSLLVFDYEGQGSDAGSLSSINSGTTEGSQDYDYLNDWGPRFNKIADQYAGDDSD